MCRVAEHRRSDDSNGNIKCAFTINEFNLLLTRMLILSPYRKDLLNWLLRTRVRERQVICLFYSVFSYFLDPPYVDTISSRRMDLESHFFLQIHACCISLIAHFQWISFRLFICFLCVRQMELLVRLNLTLNFDCLLTQPKWQFYTCERTLMFAIYISCINFSLFVPSVSSAYFYWRNEWIFFTTFGQHLFVTEKNNTIESINQPTNSNNTPHKIHTRTIDSW